MYVAELMRPTADYVDADATPYEAARLMRDSGAASLVVMTGGAVAGIITERDMVLGCMAAGHVPWECSVKRHMARQRQTIAPDTHVGDASLIVIDGEFEFLPVLDNGRLAGMLASESVFGVIDSEMAHSTV